MRRINKYKKEPERNQKRITQFFTRTQSSTTSTDGTPSSSSTTPTLLSTPVRQPRRPQWSDDGDYSGIEVLTPPPPSPKVLVDLLSSSDELDDNDNDTIAKIKTESKSPRPHVVQNEPQPSTSSPTSSNANASNHPHPPPSILLHPPEDENSNDSDKSIFSIGSDELLSQVDVDQVVRLSQEKSEDQSGAALILENSPSYSPLGDDSSGDEILSQIDIDEVIRSSQSSLNTTEEVEEDNQSPSLLSTPNKENREKLPLSSSSSSKTSNNIPFPTTTSSTFKSPYKKVSPKSQLTKYSPIRHLNKKKRTSSEASLDTVSPKHSQSPTSQSPAKYRQSQNPANSQSPTKRRLDFGGATSSSPASATPAAGHGLGQARYFLRNFLTILTEVVSDPFHSHLIHKEDHHLVRTFLTLSLDAQHLYVRQFQRKWVWRPINKLNNKNKELPVDLTECCADLCVKGYLDKINAENCGSIEDLLDILDLGKLASLVKKMKLNPVKKTKEALKDSLLSIGKNQKTLTGKNLTSESGAVLRKHALQELGQAFRVSMETKLVFSRLFLLHAPPQYWEVENDQASNQLLIVLLNQMGQMEYPSYKIKKCTQVYPTRDHLIRFHDCFTLHSNLVALGEGKMWSEMVDLTVEAKEQLENILSEKETQDYDAGLPTFLRIYTAGSVLTHGLWLGVDAYQKLKRWREANEGIRFLLGQNNYLGNYRGRWWERLVINSETHLRMGKEKVRELILERLRDTKLKEHHRFTLSQRLEKVNGILEKKSKSKAKVKPKPKAPPPKSKKKVPPKKRRGRRRKVYEDESEEDEDETDFEEEETVNKVVGRDDDLDTQVIELEVSPEPSPEDKEEKVETLFLKHEIKSRTITGEKLDQGPGAMGKSVFISKRDASGGNRMGSVEQFVIDHYLDNEGYTCGIHGEGSTIVTIYGLLFWDVIYHDEVADAFHNKYQPFPLDLHFEEFYERRRDLIEEKLQLIRSVLGMEDLIGVVDEVWGKNEKKLSIVNWGMFEDGLDRLKGLMRAMGRGMIADFCERLARNYRQYCSGFPDLVVWKEEGAEGGQGHLEVGGGGMGNCENSCECIPVGEGNGRVLFVEVKGPGDHLSEKQQLWLDFMAENGIPAEVCLVKAQSNKRIRLCK